MKMTKRVLSFILALVMIFSSSVVLSFADDETEYCSYCGSPCEWRDENTYGCQVYRGLYCTSTECGLKKTGDVVYRHDYQQYSIEKATCSKTGLVYYACEVPGCYSIKTEELPIDPEAHSYTDWNVIKEATCNVLGLKERVCINEDDSGNPCGHLDSEVIPYDDNAHVFPDEWTERTAPTCQADGEAFRICTVCSEKEETKVIPAHSKTWYEYKREEASCSKEGTSYVVCTKCNTNGTVVIPKNDMHSWILTGTTVEATCTQAGESLWTCRWHRDVTKTEEIPATDHSFTNYVTNGDARCGVDGTKTAKCDNCDEKDTVTDVGSALKHTESKWIVTSGSCKNGDELTAYKNCVYCKMEMVSSRTFPAGTHLNRQIVTVPETCINDGYTADICTDCNTVFGEKTVIPAKHTYPDEWTIVKEPSCSEPGRRERICVKCDYVESMPIGVTEHRFLTSSEAVAATCVLPGKTASRYCLDCKVELPSEVIPAQGHNDADNNGCCDRCYRYYVVKENGEIEYCDCFCHNEDGIAKLLFKIFNFLYKLLGIKQTCLCGKQHYESTSGGLFG